MNMDSILDQTWLTAFLKESLAIEGIHRAPSPDEVDETRRFVLLAQPSLEDVNRLQHVYTPDHPLRDRPWMNVSVGNYVAPKGGPEIIAKLSDILLIKDPWTAHVEFELLHPYLDGNGRTGRAIWANKMIQEGKPPYVRTFLHSFYYQTLNAAETTILRLSVRRI
jgi:hypothetical protein